VKWHQSTRRQISKPDERRVKCRRVWTSRGLASAAGHVIMLDAFIPTPLSRVVGGPTCSPSNTPGVPAVYRSKALECFEVLILCRESGELVSSSRRGKVRDA
jgi:hypothetical protein